MHKATSCALQIVVASCNNTLAWATGLASAHRTLVVEQCGGSCGGGCASLGGLPTVHIGPNLGREAHAYLWYIAHYYHRLCHTTLFLQGDAPRHLGGIMVDSRAAAQTSGDPWR